MTDPFTALALTLISGAGTDFGRRLLSLGARARERRAFERGEIEADASVQDAIARAAKRLSSMHAEIPGVGEDALQRFLVGREATQLVRQLYVFRAAGKGPLAAELKLQFVESLAAWLGTRPQRLEPHAGYVFDAFSEATERALAISAKHGDQGAESARRIRESAQLAQQLKSIERNIRYLSGAELDLAAISHFEERYRARVLDRESELRPPSFKDESRFRLEELYIAPRLRRSAEPDVWLPYDEFAGWAWKVVILGDPGAGKSSLAAKLCEDTITESGPFAHGNFPATPILVPLRDYFGGKNTGGGASIIQFVERRAVSRYQLDAVPPGAMAYLLRNGRAFFLFDQLDEVIDRDDRKQVVGDVESVVGQFPQAPVFVLSRRSGYGEAPLRSEWFTNFELGGFEEPEVREYAGRWFEFQKSSEDPDEHVHRRDAFLEETESVPDLRSNPLMLALLANMYRGPGSIPETRPSVLKNCALMLYDKWDRRRKIVPPRDFRPDKTSSRSPGFSYEVDLRRLLESLAQWIYADARLQKGVTTEQLVERTAVFLHKRLYEDDGEGREAAVELIDFCSGRAWVFSPVGRSDEDEQLYAFAHTTFLEYFAASDLVARNDTSLKVFSALWPRIVNGDADQMVQLAMHMHHERLEAGSDELIDSLLANAPVHEPYATAVLALTARALGFLEPEIAKTRTATRHVLVQAAILVRARDGRATELIGPLAHARTRISRHVAAECTSLVETGLADAELVFPMPAADRSALDPYVKQAAEQTLAAMAQRPPR